MNELDMQTTQRFAQYCDRSSLDIQTTINDWFEEFAQQIRQGDVIMDFNTWTAIRLSAIENEHNAIKKSI